MLQTLHELCAMILIFQASKAMDSFSCQLRSNDYQQHEIVITDGYCQIQNLILWIIQRTDSVGRFKEIISQVW